MLNDKTGRQWRQMAIAGCASMLLASGAHAANSLTEAGTSVSNTFTLDYDVGSVAQPTITNDNISPPPGAVVQGTPTLFTVDRIVDHSITATNSTLSSPPGTNATLTFELLNEGNDTQAYSFSVDDLDNAAGTFDASSISLVHYIDTDDDGDFTDETGVAIAQTVIGTGAGSAIVTGDVPKGVRVLIEVTGTIASSVADAETDDVTLVAEVRDPSAFLNEASATPAAVTQATAGVNNLTGAAQNVLADGTGVAAAEAAGDADGLFAATGIIEIASPDLSATKDVMAISEPAISAPAVTDCATATPVANAKAIPGACIEYVIEVQNTGTSATASNLSINDILPDEVTFISVALDTPTTGFADDPGIAGVGPVLSAPVANTSCDGTAATCDITLSDAVLAAGDIGQIRIRALVD
jgi:uncharacterized repeat protein (TIGR01451 family)